MMTDAKLTPLQALIGQGVIGHQKIIRLLQAWVLQPSHGYVLHGVSNLGKHLLAEQFIQALIFREGGTAVALRAHPDVIILQAEEGKKSISVENVRKARMRLLEKPMVAERMILYVPQADQFHEEGLNALLKVLEEPQAGTVFIFVADTIANLPATITSRMVLVPFQTVPTAEITQALMERGIEPEQAAVRSVRARGRVGSALLNEDRDNAAAGSFLSAASLGERLELIENLVKACDSSEDVTKEWRRALAEWGEIFRLALPRTPGKALIAGEGVITAQSFVGGPLSPRLPLEAAAVRLSSAQPFKNFFPTHIPSVFPRIFI
ncbi:hypothetical protein KKF59_02835 [Patescibacteria group bacterium]|nr:hypothetical protein [Patescibacteria group bacterium]MBU1908044.1 hypothetical protein [Patescibacteria group bacterium]